MSSHINPEMQPTRDLSSYKFYSQKVLPLVYDESISYYEVLCKVVTYLNTVIDNVNADIDNIETLQEAFLTLQQYVNDFFSDVEQLEDYTDRAETAALAAQGYSASAANYAASSATYASNSANSSVSSASSATSAANSAATSAEMASSAATSASNAATSSSTAITKASQASTSASNALASANTAAQKAVEASNSATSAEEDSLIAEGYAVGKQNGVNVDTNSEYYHNNAKYYASQAESAGNNAPAIVSSASGDIATFYDGADDRNIESLVCTIEPVQDLNRQANPYPAGGGENAFQFDSYFTEGESVTENGITATYSNGYLTVTGTNELGSTFNIIYKQISGTLGAGTYITPNERMFVRASVDSGSNTNYNQTFTASTDVSLVALYVAVPASASNINWKIPMFLRRGNDRTNNYIPYANVCPITGWTEMNLHRTGKNILPFPYYNSSQTINGVMYTVNSNGTVTVNGTAEVDSTFELCRSYPFANDFITGKTIRITGCPNGGSDSTYYLNVVITGNKETGSGITLNNFKANYFRFNIVIKSGTTVNNLVFKPMVSFDTSATYDSYEPYDADTISVDWTTEAGTVYGGTIDVISGKLTATMATLDLGSINYTYNTASGINYFRSVAIQASKAGAVGTTANMLCSIYKLILTQGAGDLSNNTFFPWTDKTLFIRNDSYTDATAFKTAMNGVQLVYELATPVEYQLTAHQLQTLLATNNIFCDTGSIQLVNYTADTKMYIDNLTEADSDMVADNNIESGKYFVVNNHLYLSTTAIAQGAAIVVGTNCTETDIAEALNTINS